MPAPDIRLAGQDDWLEDLHHSVRELQSGGMTDSVIRRYVNQSLKGQVPAPIRERVEGGPQDG